ncbi:MAG: tetratricopeptide repeat protein, partial [Thermodesulfobacteriota bacterium]
FEKAEPLQRQSLNIMEKRLGMNHPDLVKYLNALVVTCARQDRYEAAEHFHARILNIAEKVHGNDHPETRKARHYLNTLRLSRDKKVQTDSNEKEPTLLSVQTLSESDPTSFSEEKWQTLTDRMAELADQGHHPEGFAVAMEAAHLAETALGSDHPRVAEALTQAAGFLEQMDESEEAIRLYAKAFEVLERAYGADSIEASIGLDRMARLYEDQENYAGAAAMADRSMVIWKDTFGADHPTVKSRMKDLAILKKKALQNQTPAVAETPPKASPPPPKRSPKTAISLGDKTGESGRAFTQAMSRIERAIRDLPRSFQLDRFSGNWQTRFGRFFHHFTLPQWILILMGIGGIIFLLLKDWN